jgi:hypothetical protein
MLLGGRNVYYHWGYSNSLKINSFLSFKPEPSPLKLKENENHDRVEEMDSLDNFNFWKAKIEDLFRIKNCT